MLGLRGDLMSLDKYKQNIAFQSNWFKEEKEYWLDRLANKEAASSLSFESSLSSARLDYASYCFEFPQKLSQRLLDLSNNNNQALFVILLSSFVYLLSRYNGQEDVFLGIPSLTRSKLTRDHLFPLQINLKEDSSFRGLVEMIKEGVLAINRYNNVSLDKILAELDNGFSSGYLFKTIVLLENIHGQDRALGMPYELCVSFLKEEEKIFCRSSFLPSLFSLESLKRLCGHLVRFYEEIPADYNCNLKDIDILAPEEKRELLVDFNSTYISYDQEATPRELFEEEVRRNPNRLAVVSGGSSLTYQELNEKANSLAGFLQKKAVKANDLVGLKVGRGLESLVGLWGILKAGAGYLPMEANCPPERISYMLKDSQAKIILADDDKFSCDFVECIDLRDESLYELKKDNLAGNPSGKDLAYVIYTSGSTGEPKGVMVENHSLVSLVKAMERVVYSKHGEALKVAMVAPLIFDSSVEVIFSSLLLGHTLYIVPEDTRFDGEKLIEYYRENSIEITDGTPAHVHLMVNAPCSYEGLTVKAYIIGGEEFKKELLERFLERFPARKPIVINSYGPTECTSDATTFTLTNPQDLHKFARIPIGKPISNTKIFILSPLGQIQPLGVPGELCISGAGLARGYLKKPNLTASLFLDNPFLEGERMYRTGDLARWLEDGNIEFLGRLDRQVQVKGYRVELGEIESVLLGYPGLREVVVTVKETLAGHGSLCAYYVAREKIEEEKLRSYLGNYLASYMWPAYFIHLKEIPLTKSGKTDFASLIDPLPLLAQEQEYLGPSNELEERLVAIWQEELGLERIGIKDNFFALGGDSLGAMRIYGRLAEEFTLSLADIFKYQDIASLAENLVRQKGHLKERLGVLRANFEKGKEFVFPASFTREYQRYNRLLGTYKKLPLRPFSYQNVFLTGATGYLGNYILYELLTKKDCHIYLLLRGTSLENSEKRIKEITDYYHGQGFYDDYKDRVTIVRGDLKEENLALKSSEISYLGAKIDYIIHGAADVRHYGAYQDFYRTNVLGTKRIIDLALSAQAQLAYISSMSLGLAQGKKENPSFFSEFSPAQPSSNYYLQSKKLAEDLIVSSQEKGLHYKIFRVGNLVFDSKKGSFQKNIASNAFYSLFKFSLEEALIPKTNIKILEFSFVDYVAQAVVLLSSLETSNSVYHVFNKNRLSPLKLASYLENSFEPLELGEIFSRLEKSLDEGGFAEYSRPLFMYLDLLTDMQKGTFFLAKKTELLLKRMDFQWPRVEKKHIRMMIDHCQKVGFLT